MHRQAFKKATGLPLATAPHLLCALPPMLPILQLLLAAERPQQLQAAHAPARRAL